MKLAPNEFYAIRFKNSNKFAKTSSGKFTWYRAGHAKLALHSYIRSRTIDYNFFKTLDKTKYLNNGWFIKKDNSVIFLVDSILHEVPAENLYNFLLERFVEIVKVQLCEKE